VIITPILICERRLGDPRVTFIPTQSIYERAPGRAGNITHTSDLTSVKYLSAVKWQQSGDKFFETGTADPQMHLKLSVG
jgi:hypothetical protein